jgi:type I restriction enzyme S subunit
MTKIDNISFGQAQIISIPEEWEFVRLGDGEMCQIVMGQSPPSSTYNKLQEGLPFLQGNMEFGEYYPSPSIYCSEPIKIAEKNDVLISVRAPVGEVNISPSRVCIGRGLAAIRGKPNKINDLFLFYHLKHIGKKLESISSGSTFKAIRRNDLDQLELFLPPLPEQKKIAEILSTVDQGIEKVDEAIKKTQRLKKGLMQELLTKGIGQKEFKDTEIGRIPKEWEVVKLGEIIKYEKGRKPKKLFDREEKNTIPYLSAETLRTGAFTKWATENRELIKVNNDDVILIWDGYYCGDSFIGFDGLLSSTMIKIEPKNPNLNKRFLFYFLKACFKELNTKISGMYLKHVNKFILESQTLPLPPLPEQQKIARMLSTVDNRLELLRNRREKLERVKNGLMNDLLTGRKRVKL